MSAISAISNSPTGFVAPISLDAPAPSGSSFSQTLAVAQTPSSWLTTAEASQAGRPNIKEFMDRTGAEFLTASELLYGVVGSNTDVRDWSVIMGSKDPTNAARQATAQMYGRTDIQPRTDVTYMGASDTVAKEGNFAVRLLKDKDEKVVDQGLKLIDANGLLLRDAGSNPQTIAHNAWLFGFDTQPLAKLAEAATKVSTDLGKAVQLASTTSPASSSAVADAQKPVRALAAENAAPMSSTGMAAPSNTQATTEPVVTAQVDDQATSPALQQAIQKATASALSYVDSATYLGSLFNGAKQ